MNKSSDYLPMFSGYLPISGAKSTAYPPRIPLESINRNRPIIVRRFARIVRFPWPES
jgi:hypothetical protein